MAVRWDELLGSFEFVSFAQQGEHQAVLCTKTGEFFFHSDAENEDWPDDIAEGDEKYISIPHKLELGLGKRLVLDFVAEFLPDRFDEVEQIFSRRGAYARFKDLLHRSNALDRWHDFEAKASEKALREWV